MHSFSPSTGSHKNGPWDLAHFPNQERECHQPVLALPACVGIPFPPSDSMCSPLFCLSACVSGPQAHPQLTISDPMGRVLALPLRRGMGYVRSHLLLLWPRGPHALLGAGPCALPFLSGRKEVLSHLSLGCCCLCSVISSRVLISSLDANYLPFNLGRA